MSITISAKFVQKYPTIEVFIESLGEHYSEYLSTGIIIYLDPNNSLVCSTTPADLPHRKVVQINPNQTKSSFEKKIKLYFY